jgi:DNA-binding CsgD family transcriptional regulator
MPLREHEKPELNQEISHHIEERDYRGLKIVQDKALSLFIVLASENQLRSILESYIGPQCSERYADSIQGHVNQISEIFVEWSRENKKDLFFRLYDIDKFILNVSSSDTFHSPREIAQELFKEERLDGVMGFVTEDYELFKMNVTSYLLQQLCRIQFSNPEVRISIHATERFANDEQVRFKARQTLDLGRINRGLLPYSQEEKETLIRLWHEGVSINEISKTLGRSFGSVQYHAAKYELPLRRENRVWTLEEVSDLLLYKQERGLSNSQIAEILNRTEKAVHSKLVGLGETSFTRTIWDDEEYELFRQLLDKHSTYDEVLEHLSAQFPRGRKKNDLIAKANINGLRIKSDFELHKTELEKLLSSGISDKEIAQQLVISRKTLRKWKRKINDLL